MDRSDWTPAVLITASVCLLTAGLVWLVAPWDRFSSEFPGPGLPRHRAPAHVVVWTGEFAPGVKGVLAPVWGDAKPDRDHARLLNEDLGLDGESELVYFRLLVFNTTPEAHTLHLEDGAIRIAVEEGSQPVPMRSLAAMLERDEVDMAEGLAFSLRSLGALQRTVELPAGGVAKLIVPFGRRASLEAARAVATENGTALRRRQMAAAAFRRLITTPGDVRVEDF
jgi:hypothetical protein